ncbi:linear primary-alkylsulfatase-like [Saccostrea cucullata]|uniref:linear primary-alkylsulfatase-like n=1 Tax=Saccostrea cuccullata TaxID=36930 RepID=UPI002ED24749
MEGPQIAFFVLLLALTGYLGNRLWTAINGPSYKERIQRLAAVDHQLHNHTVEFARPEIIQVTDGLYMAIGYALANSIMIEGKNEIVIVDVTESYETALEIMAAFRNITKKPVAAIIYTHNHADHTYGAKAFIEKESSPPDIWAHESINKEFQRTFTTNTAGYRRAMRQFGVFLPDAVNSGIGKMLKYGDGKSTLGLVFPNKFVHKRVTNLTLAGIEMSIVHIPGETDDQIGVWLPKQDAFLCADDMYKAFPNLYAIRGTPDRNLLQWVESIDTIIEYNPQFLVPSHTRPLVGKSNIQEVLTVYRDAIQYIHDQTLRYINMGMDPTDIANKVTLPKNLKEHPYLQEFYGTTEWSVRTVFTSYLGWFSGDAVDLSPLSKTEKADRMIKLVGVNKLLEQAREALRTKDFQWALELSTYVLITNPGHREATEIKLDSLTSLGSRQKSANGRNYYLTSAFEEASLIDTSVGLQKSRENGVKLLPINLIFRALQIRFKPEDCGHVRTSVYFSFKDSNTHISLTIRNGIAIVKNGACLQCDVVVTTTEKVFKDMIGSRIRSITAYGSGEIEIQGGAMNFRNIMSCFERS